MLLDGGTKARGGTRATVVKTSFIMVVKPERINEGSAALPGLRSSLRLEGESMRSRASAASMVLSEQWTLVP